MLDILKNFNKATSGNKPAGPAQAGSMKAILESFDRASKETVEECGSMPMQAPSMQSQGNPVTMNVSLTASGKENVDELISLMKMAGVQSSQPTTAIATSPQDKDMAAMKAMIVGKDDDMEEWANSPEGAEGDVEYQDDNYMTKDLAGGLNREKPRKAIRTNDPALESSIKAQLLAALNEKKKCKTKKSM